MMPAFPVVVITFAGAIYSIVTKNCIFMFNNDFFFNLIFSLDCYCIHLIDDLGYF